MKVIPAPWLTMDEFNENLKKLFESVIPQSKTWVSPGDVLVNLENQGILKDDPRIDHVVKIIGSLDPSLRVDLPLFEKIVYGSFELISSALTGGLVIPEFNQFCHQIHKIYDKTKAYESGRLADYIPNLAHVDPEKYAISICTIDGQRYNLGDADDLFCLQSTSKPVSYGLALEEFGEEKVHSHVGREPSGHGFNEITLNKDGLPHNPLINAGAIMTSSLIRPDLDAAARIDVIINTWKRLCGGTIPSFDLSVYLAERDTADRNFALGYFMREHGAFEENVNLEDVLKLYFQTCSIQFNTRMLSVAAATLANAGVCPLTNDEVFSPSTVKNVLSIMYSCGMYDFSGEFAFSVGLPAKSGVSGSLLIVIPNVMGIAVWSPRIDKNGNSVRGLAFCQELVSRFNFHNYDFLLASHDKINPRNQNSEVMKKLSTFIHITYEISKLSEHVDVKVVLDKVVEFSLTLINAERGTIFVNDSTTQELYAFIEKEGETEEIRFPNHIGIAGTVFTQRKAIIIHDPYNDSRFNPEVDRQTGFKTRNIIAAPITTVKNEVVGVIQLLNREHGSFNDEDKKLLNLITSQASLAILNAHNYRKKLERKRLKEDMRELNLNVLKGKRLEEITRNLEKMFKQVVECSGALLFHFDEQSNTLVFTKDSEHSISLSMGGGIGEAVASQQCLIIDEEVIQQIQPIVEEQIVNGIAMPLVDFTTEDCIGLLIAYNKEDGSFASDAIEVIKQFLPEIAITLRHSLVYEDLMNKLS